MENYPYTLQDLEILERDLELTLAILPEGDAKAIEVDMDLYRVLTAKRALKIKILDDLKSKY